MKIEELEVQIEYSKDEKSLENCLLNILKLKGDFEIG